MATKKQLRKAATLADRAAKHASTIDAFDKAMKEYNAKTGGAAEKAKAKAKAIDLARQLARVGVEVEVPSEFLK